MAKTMPPAGSGTRQAHRGTRNSITSVPTTYRGVRYRSMLEADWAAMFTHLGVYYQYEPQPWKLPSGAVYDPDFYLPNHRTYCEAKGPHNERLWKPEEFNAALEATTFPHAFQVVILRPAGPTGQAAWDPIEHEPCPLLSQCDNCGHWGFTDSDDFGPYCRLCGSYDVLNRGHFSSRPSLTTPHQWGCLDMIRAPRRGA